MGPTGETGPTGHTGSTGPKGDCCVIPRFGQAYHIGNFDVEDGANFPLNQTNEVHPNNAIIPIGNGVVVVMKGGRYAIAYSIAHQTSIIVEVLVNGLPHPAGLTADANSGFLTYNLIVDFNDNDTIALRNISASTITPWLPNVELPQVTVSLTAQLLDPLCAPCEPIYRCRCTC
jgi:hypothetical protein